MPRKIAFSVAGIIFLASPAAAAADAIADLQAQVQALMAQIAQLQTQQAKPATATQPAARCHAFTRDLYLDIKDVRSQGEVSMLQQFLVEAGVYPEARITGYFGPATLRALQRWQAREKIVSTGTPKSTGYGYFGPRSRAAAMKACGGSVPLIIVPLSSSQVQMQENLIGTGAEAVPGSTVSVTFIGKLVDGTVFDSSTSHGNQPLSFILGKEGIIPGFQIGVNGMREGGMRVVTIPPSLGYGSQDVKDATGKVIVPANSTLVFEIYLKTVQNSGGSSPADIESKRQQVMRGISAIEPALFVEFVRFLQKIQASPRTDIPNLRAFADTWNGKIMWLYGEAQTLSLMNPLGMPSSELDSVLTRLVQVQKDKQMLLAAYNTLSIGEIEKLDSPSAQRDARRISDLKQLQLALELYYDINSKYPAGFTEKGTQPPGVLGLLQSAGVISTVPVDPQQGTPYTYASRSTGAGYVLATVLEDGTNSALSTDIDGTISGDYGMVGCDDAGKIYCVSD